MARPNPQDQKLQSVLYMMDISVGSHGIDGIRGPDTTVAMRAGASRLGALGNSASEMERAITDKLKDPAFRAAALEKLKQIEPPTKDSIIAMQTVLAAAGHSTIGMQDPRTGLMNGKLNNATLTALANTEDGKPNAAAYLAQGQTQSTTQLALNGGGGRLGDNFQVAAVGLPPLAPQTPAAVSPDVRVSLASITMKP